MLMNPVAARDVVFVEDRRARPGVTIICVGMPDGCRVE